MKRGSARCIAPLSVARSRVTRGLRAGLLGTGSGLATAARAEGGKGPVNTHFASIARAQGKVDRTHGFGPAARASGK